MTNAWHSPIVTCRPALPSDRADVFEFTKFIWDGHDYIQYVWDEWFADPNGILVSAEFGGHCVGIGKIVLSAPGQWWFQGFRVDPKYQGLKIGSHIHAYLDQWWLENGDGTARLMTGSQRVKVHHLCEKLGYVKILEVKEITAEPLDQSCTSFRLVEESEVAGALQAALDSPVLVLSKDLFDVGWDAIHPTADILASIQQQGLAFWWRGSQGLLLAWEDDNEDGEVLGVGLPACPLESLPEMLLDIRRLAAQMGRVGVFWIAPLKSEILVAVDVAGYIHYREHSGYLFEKRHPTRP